VRERRAGRPRIGGVQVVYWFCTASGFTEAKLHAALARTFYQVAFTGYFPADTQLRFAAKELSDDYKTACPLRPAFGYCAVCCRVTPGVTAGALPERH
jgi:hypothetical protein